MTTNLTDAMLRFSIMPALVVNARLSDETSPEVRKTILALVYATTSVGLGF